TRAMPGKVPVAGSGVLVVTYISTSELGGAGRVVVANPVSGGSGASGERDGISGTEMSVRVFAQRAGRGARSRGAGRRAPLWPGAGQRGAGEFPRGLRRRLRAGDPPSERSRRDARQGPPALLRLGRRWRRGRHDQR